MSADCRQSGNKADDDLIRGSAGIQLVVNSSSP